MRHPILFGLCAAGAIALAACDTTSTADVDRAFQGVNAVDGNNLNDVMLTVADPEEAVSYFQRSLGQQPDRIDLQRGLAKSLVRAKRQTEAVSAWKAVVDHAEATDDDRVDFADALIRNNEWDRADKMLDTIPPTFESFKRYRLEAMVADSNREWKKADSFYEIAIGLTTRPAGVMNNWGYSKLSRGDFSGAERLFSDAIRQDNSLFTAKNNLMMARGAQQNYAMPVIPVSQTERAQLLYTLALSAIKQGGTRENLDADALGTPLMNMKLYEPCKPKPNQKVTIRVAIWDGRAVGVDVSVGPKGDDKLASCIKEQIRTVTWRDKVKSLNTVDYAF